jgi:branched-chain polyamine synthase A-like protein
MASRQTPPATASAPGEPGGSVHSDHTGAAAAPVDAVAELIWRCRPDTRRLRRLVALLTGQPLDLAALVQRSALPRQTVESVLAALGGDLLTDDGRFGIQPAVVPAYRERFGYEQLARTEPADPLAGRLGAAAGVIAAMTGLAAAAPPARTELDHVPATPKTLVRRALWLESSYDLDGGTVLFVGDHDLTSLAVGQVIPGAHLVVVDVDEATLRFIAEQAARLGLRVRCLAADLRFGLPEAAAGCADLVFTDPPYTPQGIGLFAARGLQGLRDREHGCLIAAYGFSDRHPALGFAVQAAAHRLALVTDAMLPRFNTYLGAQAVGSSSALYVWRPTARTWRVLDSASPGGLPGIYTRGPQAAEHEEAGLTAIPPGVLAATAGFPIRVLAGGRWEPPAKDRPETAPGAARIRLGTLLAAGLPPGSPAGPDGALVADLTGDQGPWLLRALLAANAGRVVAVVPSSHPDLAGGPARQELSALLAAKFRLRFEPAPPGGPHAMVVAEAVEEAALGPPGQVAQRLLRRAHGKVGNVWREALVAASRGQRSMPLTKREARAVVQASPVPPEVLETRLIELPRHQLPTLLAEAAASLAHLPAPP